MATPELRKALGKGPTFKKLGTAVDGAVIRKKGKSKTRKKR